MKTEKKLRRTLTPEQIEKLLTFKPSRRYQRRMQAAIALMLDTGLRSAEWRNLTRQDMDLESLHVKVYGKGKVRWQRRNSSSHSRTHRYPDHYDLHELLC